MSRIKGKWTTPEILIHEYLKTLGINHTMHPKILGHPDILIDNTNRIIFINGCFWHKCPICYNSPKSRIEYWEEKINKNLTRDKLNEKTLIQTGWYVVILWEHEIKKNLDECILRILGD